MNMMRFYVNKQGQYLGGWDNNPPSEGIEVPVAPGNASYTWDFKAEKWIVTEDEMKQAEILQDKQYLADTDWIIAKIGEVSLTGQDTALLVAQYQSQLDAREQARIRIRLNEGRI